MMKRRLVGILAAIAITAAVAIGYSGMSLGAKQASAQPGLECVRQCNEWDEVPSTTP
jgi:hypothetical protein